MQLRWQGQMWQQQQLAWALDLGKPVIMTCKQHPDDEVPERYVYEQAGYDPIDRPLQLLQAGRYVFGIGRKPGPPAASCYRVLLSMMWLRSPHACVGSVLGTTAGRTNSASI